MAQAATSRRHDVRTERTAAVTRAIEAMRAGLVRSLPVADMARTGLFSPSHFHRVFREITTVTPARFLAALRMAEARAFLLHSELTVAEVGVCVGYQSLTTFSTQFARLVGVAPGHFRQLARAVGDATAGALWSVSRAGGSGPARRAGPLLALSGLEAEGAVVIAAVRPAGSVYARPDSWVLAAGGPPVPLGPVPGSAPCGVSAVVARPATRLTDVLVDQVPGSYLTGAARLPEGDGHRPARAPVPVALHPPGPTDLPILTAAPLEWLAHLLLAQDTGWSTANRGPPCPRRSPPGPLVADRPAQAGVALSDRD
jgi:AraC-like DNA-binding protein